MLQVELSHCSRQLKDREERVEELENALKGTSLMVHTGSHDMSV